MCIIYDVVFFEVLAGVRKVRWVMAAIGMLRIDKEVLSPEDYMKLKNTNAAAIKRTRVVPCSFDKGGFGGIEVTYHSARYVTDGVL